MGLELLIGQIGCVSDNEGQQFYYFDGEPVLKSGKPLYHKAAFDKNNKILSDKNGHTLYGKDVKPLYWEDVYDKYGKPYYGELYDVDGNLCPTDTCLEPPCDPDSIPLYDEKGQALFYKPVYKENGKRIYDERGRPFDSNDGFLGLGKPLFTRDESPLLDKKGRRLYYKDGHRVMGKPLYNSSGKAIVDKSRNPLYGKPVYGVPQEHPSIDKDDNILYLRPTKGQPVSKRNGQQLYDILGKPLQHKNGIPFFDKHGDHLHGQPDSSESSAVVLLDDNDQTLFYKPVYDPDGKQLYNRRGRPLNPKYGNAKGRLLVDEEGIPILGQEGKPLHYKDKHKILGLPLFDLNRRPVCDIEGNQLFGEPIFGEPTVDESGKPVIDVDGNPLFSRPDGIPRIGKDYNSILHFYKSRSFFDKNANPLLGIPLYDKDDLPVYNNDAKPVYNKEGKLFYDEDGNVVLDLFGKPLYTKPACDPDRKPLQDKDGQQMFGKNFRPLYWDQVYNKNGKPYSGLLYSPDGKVHPYEEDKKPHDQDSIPLYDEKGQASTKQRTNLSTCWMCGLLPKTAKA
uniref:Uncharacterized protein n=1 Tax=Biomphalaria glabrata TaxID=6526 RepID=A0A2C9L467_BIOGL